MNSKGLIRKENIILVIIAIFIISFFTSASSAVIQKDTFLIGERVIINLRGYSSYELKITTPSTKFTKRGISDVVMFRPSEIGQYRLNIRHGNQVEDYYFFVVNEISSENNFLNQTNSNIIIDKPVKWIKKVNVSQGAGRTKFDLPKSENVSVYRKNINNKERIENFLLNNGVNSTSVFLDNINGEIELEYYTEAPKKQERKISQNKKEVMVSSPEGLHYQNVTAYTNITEITDDANLILVYWKEENTFLDFKALDTNNNQLIDYIEWIVPHLSEQTFEIIVITKAEHLDENRTFIEDIFEFVTSLDNLWSPIIPSGHYVRVTFEKNLTSNNDITIYPNITSGNPYIEIYEKDGLEKIAEFTNIISNQYNKVFLTNLTGTQDTFDLLILGGSIIFDHIIDPIPIGNAPIAQIYQTSVTQDVDTETSIQFNNESIIQSNFSHDTVTNNHRLTFNEDGWYKVSYGCDFLQLGSGGGSRQIISAWLENSSGTEINPSRTFCFLRDTENDRDRCSVAGVTLVNMVSGNNLTLQATMYQGTAENADPDESCWIYAEKLNRPAAQIYETTNYDHQLTTSSHITQDFGAITYEDTSDFTVDLASNWISVDQDGWYKIYYTVASQQVSGSVDNDRTTVASYLYLNNATELEPSMTYSYHKRSDQAAFTSEEGFTIANLAAGENISIRRFLIQQQQASAITNTTNNSWLLIEKLDDNNILFLWDTSGGQTATGGNSVEGTPVNITWDTEVVDGSNFTHGTGDDNFTIDEPGWFEISYAVGWDKSGGTNRRITCARLLRNGDFVEPSEQCEYTRDSGSTTTINSVAGNFVVNNTAGDEYKLQYAVTGNSPDESNVLEPDSSWISVIPVKILDFNPPQVKITFPQDTDYNSSDLPFNFTVRLDKEGSLVQYTLDNGINNITMLSQDNLIYNHTNSSLAEGVYIFQVYANDSSGNRNDSESVTFILDNFLPSVIIDHPKNLNYSFNTSLSLNYTINETNLDSCWYNLDNSPNITLAGCNNITFNVSQGSHTLYIYANDSAGKLNNSEQITFLVDSLNPDIDYASGTSNNNSNVTRDWIFVNVTVNETNELNITFNLYNSSLGEINKSSFLTSQRTINWTGLLNDIYFYNVTIFDAAFNKNTTSIRTITLDTTGPSIPIDEPQEGKTYTKNTSLELNVSIFDSLVEVDSCWWNLDNNPNQTITCGQNTTFNATDGNHVIHFYSNDSLNNLGYSNSSFGVSTAGPAITLRNPEDNLHLNYTQNIFFNYTTLDPDGIDTCSLYGNWSGEWHINQSNNVIINNSANNFSLDFSDGDGIYVWNIWCNDTSGLESFAITNFTFTIDTVYPEVQFVDSKTNVSENAETNWNYSDTPTNPHNAVDENFATFATLDSPTNDDTDIIYVNYTIPSAVNSATLEYLADWSLVAGNFECRNSSQDWDNFEEMADNLRTNETIPSSCLQSSNLQLRFYHSLTSAFGNTLFYEEQVYWQFDPFTRPNATNISQDFISANVIVTDKNEANVTFELYNSTGEVNTTTFSDNIWIINWTNLVDGTYTYDVTVYDKTSQLNYTETRTITLDATAPNASLISPLNTSYESNTTQNLTVNATDNIGLDNATFYIYNSTDDLVNETSTSIAGTEYLLGVIYEFLYDGVFRWFYRITDIAGNTFYTPNNTITIDTTNPSISYSIGTEDSGLEFERNWIFVNVTVNDTNFANLTFRLFNSTQNLINQTTFTDNNRSINFTNLASYNLTYYYNVTITDLARNTNTTTTRDLTLIDTINPSLILDNPDNTTYNFETNLPLDFILIEENIDTCWYAIDGGANVTISNCQNTTFDISQGAHELIFYVNDSLNQINSSSVSFVANSSLIFTKSWSIQRSSETINGLSNIVLSSIDPTKSFVRHSQRSSNSAPYALFATSRITNPTNLRLETYGGASTIVEWEVVTGPALTVQSGEQVHTTAQDQINLTISEVNLSASFIIVSTRLNSSTNSDNSEAMWSGRFINQTTISLERGATGTQGNISWQVVQWDGANVQNGSFSISDTTGTDSLQSSVNLTNSFLIFSKRISSGTALDHNNVGGYFVDDSTLEFYRQDDNTGFMFTEWFVVEAPIISSQRGSFDITGSTSPNNTAISELTNTSRAFSRSSWDSTGSGSTFSNAIVSYGITNSTNLQTTTGSTAGNVKNVSWQVIEIIDADKPAVYLEHPINNQNISSTFVEFNYSVADNSSLFNCSLYGNWSNGWHLNQTIDSPSNNGSIIQNFTPVQTGEGYFYWNVFCQDLYGNQGWNSTNFTFFVDSIFPTINYSIETPQTNTNLSKNWIFVNVTANDTNEANITFKLYNGSEAINISSFTDSTRSINFTGLADATYNFNVTITDLLNHRNTTLNRYVTLDTVNPSIILNHPQNISYNHNNSLSLNYSVSDTNLESCVYNINNAANITLPNCANSTFNVSQGSFILRIYANDSANNLNNSQQITFFVDSITPTIDYAPGTSNNDTNISRDWIFVNVTANDTYPDTITFNLYYSNNSLINSSSFTDSTRSINFTGLTDATYYYNVSINDTVNNFNYTITRTINLDSTAPNATLTSPSNNTYTNITSQNLTVNATDNLELDNATLYIYNSTNDLVNETSSNIEGTDYVLGVIYEFLYDGVFRWFYRITDIAGNTFYTPNNTITIDTIFPDLNYSIETELSGYNFSRNWIFVNLTLNETNFVNLTFSLHNSSKNVINESTFTDNTRSINWTNLFDGIYFYNVSSTDQSNQKNFTLTRNITLDTTPPNITIHLPQDGLAYSNNQSLELNVSVFDDFVNVDSCWWNLDNNPNQTITCGQNTTFNTTDESIHTIYFYSNDSLNNLAYVNSTFSVSTKGPATTLHHPSDNLYFNYTQDFFFNYTPTDPDGVDTCSLYGNWSGGWHLNQSDFSVLNATANNFTLDFADGEGIYIWNVLCNDTNGLNSSALSNFTFTIDTIFPTINYSQGTENNGVNISRNWIFVNVTANDTNEANITFRLYNSTGEENITFYSDSSRSINWTNLVDGTYNYNITITDLANQINITQTRSITIDSTAPNATLISPSNDTFQTNTTQNLTVNVTDNYALDNATLFIYNSTDDLINQTTTTISGTDYVLGVIYEFLYDGVFRWFYRITDVSSNVFDTTNNTLTIDTTSPQINYSFPTEENNTYFERDWIFINLSLTEPNFANITFDLFKETEVGLQLENRTIYTTLTTSINWTDLQDENTTYRYEVLVSDQTGKTNKTLRRAIKLTDTIKPNLVVDHPQNTTYTTNNSISLNYTVNDTHLDSCWYNIDAGSNVSLPNCANSTFNVSQGSHTITVYVNDTSGEVGNVNSTNITFLVDSQKPQLSFFSPHTPDNTTYWPLNSLAINVTLIEDNLVNITYELYNSTGLFNRTIYTSSILHINFTNLITDNYLYNVTIIDAVNNKNQTETRTIFVDVDNPSINYSIGTENNGAEVERDWIFVNVTGSDSNFANITFRLHNSTQNLINQTILTGSNRSINFTNLTDSNTTYYYNVTILDLAGNSNTTQTRTIELVDLQRPNLTLVNPQNTTYDFNTSIPLDFIVQDVNLESCWYAIDGGANITVSNCQNTTFDVSEGSHELIFYVNDSLNQINSSSVSFVANSSLIFTKNYNVQSSSTSVNGQQSVGISTTDPIKSFILHTSRSATPEPGTLQVTSTFLNSQTIQFQNYGSGTATVEWELITGPSITVQRGESAYSNTTASVNVSISQINLSNSFLIVNNRLFSTTSTENADGFWAGRFINDTAIEFRREQTSSQGNISWQVVQWDGANVQNGSFSAAAATTGNDFFNPVNTSQSFMIFSRRVFDDGAGDAEYDIEDTMIQGFILNTTTVQFDRVGSGGTMFTEWFIVEAPIFNVRNGTFAIAASSAAQYDNIDTDLINRTRGFNIHSHENSGGGQTFSNAFATQSMPNQTSIELIKGTGSNTGTASWFAIEIQDLEQPRINLEYPTPHQNFSTFNISNFTFSVGDNSSLINCSLYGNWSGSWHINQTIANPTNNQSINQNFSEAITEGDNYYIWNVKCTDLYGNEGWNSTNFTFSTFLFPDSLNITNFNISQTSSDGTGNITLYWNSSNHSYSYRVYHSTNLTDFLFLNETFDLNYTDNTFNGNIRRFYRVDAVNPIGQNSSTAFFGTHVYSLEHNGNSRNWIGFPTNFSYLTNANETLYEITNATAFTTFNATIQRKVSCNFFSCPNTVECTDTSCNFGLEQGKGYEVNLNTSAPALLNWSGVGIVYNKTTINLTKNSTSFGKNWISFYANTTITNAWDFITNISSADAVSRWIASSQKSEGLIISPFPWANYLGSNFTINIEKGYEVSVNQSILWSAV